MSVILKQAIPTLAALVDLCETLKGTSIMYKFIPAILVFLSVFLGLIALLGAIKNGSDEMAVFLITLSAWFAALSKFYSLKQNKNS
jgi:hypothetical protein